MRSEPMSFSCHEQHTMTTPLVPGAIGTARIVIGGGFAVVGNEQAGATHHHGPHSDLLQTE